MAKTSERELGLAVMQVLASRSEHKAHVRTLIKNVPNYVTLTDDDRNQSATRPNEEVWEQRVRNLKSHHKSDGNVIKDGYVEHAGRGMYKLTDVGVLHLRSKGLL
ncbi:hypothetical protein GCM10017083_41180 [Thalassobaculum fulvum]|uniref:Restriction system protein Mrr-like N-terminal domain-containing protein n=1 Tax=Thalassobaculum fulvum TaxID=1633335 RepID=A0A918XVT5_9PROT|nr:winged helix-turn-helix domain-containing protein [Thalassobaculum fulvum]GHD58348.1 hypothetical protein GCM10017083_41180 [Thalassobaculum fulvum]